SYLFFPYHVPHLALHSFPTRRSSDLCDYLIDYHGGDLDESLRPYAYWGPTGHSEQDRVSKEMVLAFGLDHIIIWSERRREPFPRSEEHTSELQSRGHLVCRLLLEKKK